MTAPALDAPGWVAGVYPDMTDDEYHDDPVPGGSLSASGAKKILACPARYHYERDHPVYKGVFDVGSAAHKLVLGTGPDIAVIGAPDWRTAKAKAERDAARAAGKTPVLEPEYEVVQEMALAIRQHPVAAALLDPERGGQAEQSLFWQDAEYGIWRRARLDWLPSTPAPGRFIITDYKTCAAADKASITKAVGNYGYHQQDAWYTDAVRALGLADDPAFLFIFQEKTPPYLITVAQLDYDAVQAGRLANQLAMERYRDCTEAGKWPGYSDDIELISLPPWTLRQLETL